jgi:hypothetical protein
MKTAVNCTNNCYLHISVCLFKIQRNFSHKLYYLYLLSSFHAYSTFINCIYSFYRNSSPSFFLPFLYIKTSFLTFISSVILSNFLFNLFYLTI